MKTCIGMAAIGAISALALAGPAAAQDLVNDEATLNLLVEEGAAVYSSNCAACHGADGTGGGAPALINSRVAQSRSAVIFQVLFGALDHGMPAFNFLSDREVAAVTTYVRNSWGNEYGLVLPRSVELRRSAAPESEGG